MSFPEPHPDPSWRLETSGFDPVRESDWEARFSLSNGRLGTRGSLEEANLASATRMVVAWVFGPGPEPLRVPVQLPAPVSSVLALDVGGRALALGVGETVSHVRILDMRSAVLYRDWVQRDPQRHLIRMRTARFVSLAERDVVAMRVEITLLEGPADSLILEAPLIPPPSHPPVAAISVAHREKSHLVTVKSAGRGGVAAAAVLRPLFQGAVWTAGRAMWHAEPGVPYAFDRVAVYSESVRGAPIMDGTGERLKEVAARGFDEALELHRGAWERRWQEAEVDVEGDDEARQALRFAVYHLVSAADPQGQGRASIGARALTGPAYHGHVFWDTEVFVLPFFIYTDPTTSRSLLAYRHRTLPAARRRAQRSGFKGALYAWESADTGDDVTPLLVYAPGQAPIPVLSGLIEHHISADVAWAFWEYWQLTGDDDFFAQMGLPVILETARFWVSRAEKSDDGRFHIRSVVGPDEYHEDVDDSVFTNVMARWNLRAALQAADWCRREDPGRWDRIKQELSVTPNELGRFRRVADRLVDGFDRESKLFEQFTSFFSLKDPDVSKWPPRPFPADAVFGPEYVRTSQTVKQADVVALMHLREEEFPDDVAERNFLYYEKRTCHGSSLSPGVYATVGARVGQTASALESYHMASRLDLGEEPGRAAGGIHIAAQGGIWQAAVMGFGGLRASREEIRLRPRLPEGWTSLSFGAMWRGRRLKVRVSHEELIVDVYNDAVTVRLDGHGLSPLAPGRHVARRTGGAWAPLEASPAQMIEEI